MLDRLVEQGLGERHPGGGVLDEAGDGKLCESCLEHSHSSVAHTWQSPSRDMKISWAVHQVMMWSWKRDIGPWTTLRVLAHCDANEESCC